MHKNFQKIITSIQIPLFGVVFRANGIICKFFYEDVNDRAFPVNL